jgi:hypothetical protein
VKFLFRIFRIVVSFACASACLGQSLGDPVDGTFRAKKIELHHRIEAGDYTALADAASMPAGVSIPYLWWYADQASHPAREPARAALKNVRGYEGYFVTKLGAASASGGVDEQSFEILSVIGTHEAAAVVAPYLFDFTTTDAGSDTLSSIAAVSAAISLGGMKLPGAAVQGDQKFCNADDVVAWQKWAVAQGMVPKEWSSRVGNDKVLRQLRAVEEAELVQSRHPSTPKVIHPSSERSSPPIDTAFPSSTVARSPAPLLERSALVWPWIAGLVALIVIVAVAMARRA